MCSGNGARGSNTTCNGKRGMSSPGMLALCLFNASTVVSRLAAIPLTPLQHYRRPWCNPIEAYASPQGARRMILKLKRTPGLFLVGFMGSGKSTVGRSLARHLGWRFADLAEDIESRERMTISEIFEKLGEEGFRRAETSALERRIGDVSRGVPWVVAVGGGCFTQAMNIDLVQNHGISIWLDAPLEMIRARIGGSSHRPLARDPRQLEDLYIGRRCSCERADYRIVIAGGGSGGAGEGILGREG